MAYKIVNDDSLTSVANAIRVQGSISGTLEFPDGFVSAIQNLSPSPTLQTKSVTYTPSDSAITDTVTADSGYDGLDEVDVTVNAVPEADFGASVGLQFYAEDGVEKCEVSGGGYAETAGWIDEGSVLTREVHPAIASGTTITPTTSSQTIGGYKTVMEGAVTINPIPSQYKDTTDATATADKILQGYTAYAGGQKLTGTASGGITPSGTMSITSNGTYDVTQYASADVNVSGGGGASNVVVGTFNTGSTTGVAIDKTIPYNGNGYPIAFLFWVKGGAYATGTAWYDKVQRYAVGIGGFVKSNTTTTPAYDNATPCQVSWFGIYKNSASDSTIYSRSSGMNSTLLRNRDAGNTNPGIYFKNATTLSIFVASNAYGLLADTDYDYVAVYSS